VGNRYMFSFQHRLADSVMSAHDLALLDASHLLYPAPVTSFTPEKPRETHRHILDFLS
jgi:hypothetical protein